VRELSEGGEDPDGRRIEGHDEFVARYTQAPARYWGLIGFSPDFPTVAEIIEQLYPQSGGRPIDGVVALDPSAFAAFLELTGPVDVPGYPEELTPENAEEILLHRQYLELSGLSEEEREEFLVDAVEVLFDELTSGGLPGPGAIASALGPAVEGRHLQMWTGDDDANTFFAEIGATGSVERETLDSFGVVGQNQGGNKIDWFLRRDISYDLTWDPGAGVVEGTMRIRLRNDAPPSGLPQSVIGWGGDESLDQPPVDDGENLMLLSVYSPFRLSRSTLDGEPIGMSASTEAGHNVLAGYVSVPSGTTRELEVRVDGSVPPGDRYQLRALRQPTVQPDRYRARIRLTEPWAVADVAGGRVRGRLVEARWDADEARTLTVDVSVPERERSLLDRLSGRYR
jgi:hypothetical protein